MANQNQIDNLSEQISLILNKAREELIFDLFKLGEELNNEVLFMKAIQELDIADALRKKTIKASSLTSSTADITDILLTRGSAPSVRPPTATESSSTRSNNKQLEHSNPLPLNVTGLQFT